ncbi:MAG TPA: penicillin-binding protein 2 [Longimicrobiaceae bacterium]|nr:penicillin-binding protein 2 [Longimicrobiaceae bacterium]
MKLFQPDPRQRRTLGAVFMITLVISTLLTAFFQTQVLSGKQYAARSEENRLRPIKIPAPRGTIYDRDGEVVATSITGYSVSLLPASEQTIRQTLTDLMPFLGLSSQDVEVLMRKRAGRPHDLLDITDRATFPQVAAIEERRAAFPNLMIVERPMRYYPAGPAIGHIAGYVGEITREDLEKEEFRERGYEQGTWIGKAGIEKEYEFDLGGEDGARFVEMDAMGRVVDPRSSVGALAPVPGEQLKLTLDLELQKYIHRIFPDSMKGAVVAMVPSTGEILAMYSNPPVDPNEFVGGIKISLWRALDTDPAKPLLDRTITALYPPASTWKLATAAAGVRAGILKAGTRMPITCNGGMAYAGRYARCWYRAGHGSVDLAGAIEHSCNVYFYQVGIRLGLAKLTEEGTRMGFASRSGIDLPGESKPRFPTGIDWYRERFGHTPTPSEVMSLAIGQGPNSQTVLNMAHFYSAIAGNGTSPEPHLVAREGAGDGPNQIDLGLDATGLQALWDGLAAVTAPTGTARLSSIANWKVYGKTGTAQNPQGDDHGWFVGFSGPPGGHPEIVVAAIIEHGLHGSDVGPIATKAISFYLNKKHGLPFDPRPTLIERWQAQRLPWSRFDEYPAPITPISRATAATPAAPQGKAKGRG